jgi:hypothetical protein
LEGEPKIYAPSPQEGALRQGEIVTDLIQFKIDRDDIGTGDPPNAYEVRHPFSTIVSQDCDLDWDFKARQAEQETVAEHRLLPNVMFCETTTAEKLRNRQGINSNIWKSIRTNNNERYHFLQQIPFEEDLLEEGLPELALDFKRYFTVPVEEVYQRLEFGTVRRCRLISPYVEHLGNRFYSFQSRIALPSEHFSEPSSP